MKAKTKLNLAVGYTSYIGSNKLNWINSIATQTKVIYRYCLRNNIKLSAMYFESSEYEMDYEGYSMNQIAYMIRKHKVSEVICTDFDKLSLDIFNFPIFIKFIQEEGVKLTVINKSSRKNQEFSRFLDEGIQMLEESMALGKI